MNAILISSQSYRDESTVAAKIAARDFDVQVSPAFEYSGKMYQIILDGHHSYDAAIESGNEPNFIELGVEDFDAIAKLLRGEFEEFACEWNGGDEYREVISGESVI